ncbi:NUDIX hydrolase domain-like protein [Crepidotus variabilis]|uniref:Oxidized purine nucleoside triphosphate hydrolase n=1 Tax=Crepidotus variabilis TaxID=179855 RepID=A0A9P6EED7_9AGAR|nr:NUDIX hydrolase domain-like protein [Crepidotus variabilis]
MSMAPHTLETPPGLRYVSLRYHTSGGDHLPWLPFTKVKYYTNVFVVKGGKVLLGYKKRGFGKGKYNGFGGKVEPGELPKDAALRELKEEAGISATLKHAGMLLFLSEDAEWAFEIEIYRADDYEGEITESDEMRPEWFNLPSESVLASIQGRTPRDISESTQPFSSDPSSTSAQDASTASPIPYSQMWETDSIWLPLLLAKQKFVGRADFRKVRVQRQDGTEKVDEEKLEPYRWWYALAPEDPVGI